MPADDAGVQGTSTHRRRVLGHARHLDTCRVVADHLRDLDVIEEGGEADSHGLELGGGDPPLGRPTLPAAFGRTELALAAVVVVVAGGGIGSSKDVVGGEARARTGAGAVVAVFGVGTVVEVVDV